MQGGIMIKRECGYSIIQIEANRTGIESKQKKDRMKK